MPKKTAKAKSTSSSNKKVIRTNKAPVPIGPYNQAVVTGKLIYTAGQIAIDPKTNSICYGSVHEQTRIILGNIKIILEEAGSSLKNVIKTTVYLKNMDDFQSMSAVYAEFFNDEKSAPARSTIEVARLPKDVLVEIEAVATL
jgi:2-iminobutanoate/2-iminopropanoate deaminase